MGVLVLTETTPAQRRQLVAEIARGGERQPARIAQTLASRGVMNRHGKPYSAATIRRDMEQGGVISEIIGRRVTAVPLWKTRMIPPNVDRTITDYEFWDKIRRGKAVGFEFGGLLCRPLTEIIASFVWGSGPTVTLARTVEASEGDIEYTNQMLSRFGAVSLGTLYNATVDLYALGDQYPVINPDGSLSVVSPELVDEKTDPYDYRRVERETVTTQLETGTIKDEYTENGRTITITDSKGKVVESQQYENLIGRLPIIHMANDRGPNETHGRPVYEALYKLFSEYDDLMVKGLDGVKLMGNPIPTFEGMENIDETIDANATVEDEEYTDIDGNNETRKLLKFDQLSVILVGKGGTFRFASPPVGFTKDITEMLYRLFLLMLHHTRIIEGLWGGAIASSRASIDAQMPPFHQYIEGRRAALEGQGGDDELGIEPRGGLLELFDVWLRTRQLVDPRIVVGPLEIKWPSLSQEAFDVLLKWVSYLHSISGLSTETVVALSGLVDDAPAEVEKAQKERDEQMAQQADTFGGDLQAAIGRSQGEPQGEEPPADDEETLDEAA